MNVDEVDDEPDRRSRASKRKTLRLALRGPSRFVTIRLLFMRALYDSASQSLS
jgi:hypothetical protein